MESVSVILLHVKTWVLVWNSTCLCKCCHNNKDRKTNWKQVHV